MIERHLQHEERGLHGKNANNKDEGDSEDREFEHRGIEDQIVDGNRDQRLQHDNLSCASVAKGRHDHRGLRFPYRFSSAYAEDTGEPAIQFIWRHARAGIARNP